MIRYIVKVAREVEQDDGSTRMVRETIFQTVNRKRAEQRVKRTPGATLITVPVTR